MAVFCSFYYKQDAWRVQQIINMGMIEGQPVLNAQEWQEVKRKGTKAIEDWIAVQMNYKTAVVVLVGQQTADRPWVKYEINKAWNDRRPLVGIRIHGLADGSGKTSPAGANPFSRVTFATGGSLADYVPLHNPTGTTSQGVYANIQANLKAWADNAYKRP